MSLQDQLTRHLDDFVFLSGKLLEALQTGTIGNVGDQLVDKLVEKNGVLQQGVSQLIKHQIIHRRIERVRREIESVDEQIIGLASQLGDIEEELYDAAENDSSVGNAILGNGKEEPYSVHQVLVLAERLALMSAAPSEYVDRSGMSLCQPPAPLEDLMQASRLHMSIDELLNACATKPDEIVVPSIDTKDNAETSQFEIPEDWDEDEELDPTQLAALWSRQRTMLKSAQAADTIG